MTPEEKSWLDCGQIIIDFFGFDRLQNLLKIPQDYLKNYDDKDGVYYNHDGEHIITFATPNGEDAYGSHWYCVVDGKWTDSFSKRHQIEGSNTFCAAFAMYYYLLGKGRVRALDLREGKFAHNAKEICSFYKRYLGTRKRQIDRQIFRGKLEKFGGFQITYKEIEYMLDLIIRFPKYFIDNNY